MNTRLPFANDFPAKGEPAPEIAAKAVKPAEGAKTELESRLLNALRKQRFASAATLAAHVKQPDVDVRDALTDLIGRKLVVWVDESVSSHGAGYRAADFKEPAKEKSTKSSDLKDRLGFR